jgi:hypothetical protein
MMVVADGSSRHRFAHRLVAAAFLGPCPPGLQVNHKDGRKLNNAPENLEYVTGQQNLKHAREVLCVGPSQCGERNYGAKLIASQVSAIRAEYAVGGVLHKDLAAKYGVHKTAIGKIIRREKWAHLPAHP